MFTCCPCLSCLKDLDIELIFLAKVCCGREQDDKKHHLVNCQPLDLGGLGEVDLEIMNVGSLSK